MAAPFSRLQLAAALLEYDNDPSDPTRPQRSAQESAIFAHLRRHLPIRPTHQARRSSDYLGVSLPSDGGIIRRVDPADPEGRRSRASINALHNPFRASVNVDSEEEQEHEVEVDLASWGLDAFIAKDKEKNKGKGKAKAPADPGPLSSVSAHFPTTSLPPTHSRTTRSLSVGNYDHLALPEEEARRKSFASPLDLAGMEMELTLPNPHPVSPPIDSPRQALDSKDSIPFPSRSIRSPSPGPDDFVPLHQRTYSRASMDSRMMPNDENARPRSRAMSTATMGSMNSKMLLIDDNPFALRPPSRASRFDPKAAAHARTMSNASLGTQMLLNDAASVVTGLDGPSRPTYDRRPSTMDLLRPKVLVMPSPLQSNAPPQPPPPGPEARKGFEVTTDGPPLPPGARTSVRGSKTLSMLAPAATGAPNASNAFTPNPRTSLSYTQLMFRNTLMVDGGRDVSYSDIDGALPRATEEGQQVSLFQDEVEAAAAAAAAQEEPPNADGLPYRPAGKLYGVSLIDHLEHRKTEMRSKQRVFRGDDRPKMMSRARSSTLIDPEALQARPTSQRMSSHGSSGTNNRSSTMQPLLTFDGEKIPKPMSPPTRLPASKSVFGVDSLWEREMAKLKEIEAQEKAEREAEEEKQRLAEEAAQKKKKGKKKGKGREKEQVLEEFLHPPTSEVASEAPAEPRVSAEPPTLPAIQTIRQVPPRPADDSESEESEDEGRRPSRQLDVAGWNAHSSDEEQDGPRRTTGVGPRYPSKRRNRPANLAANDDSDEDDVPLSATVSKVMQRVAASNAGDSDSDEEQPLSVVLKKAKSKSSLLPPMDFEARSASKDSDDDDEPLGVRASRLPPSSSSRSHGPMEGGDDDDQPLAFHPEQQRRTQYQMMMMQQQQQQQQQQMMMMQARAQAQMHNSMFFHPAMMGSGFFPPPMGPAPMMMPPVQAPSPPPIQDAGKYGRVDQWRHNVAVEGST